MIIDPRGRRRQGLRDIDRSEFALGQQKAVLSGGVVVAADDLPAAIDPEGLGARAARDIDRGELAPVQQKAMARPARVQVEAHDLALVVDAVGKGVGGARRIDGEREGATVPQKPVEVRAGAVHPHELTPAVYSGDVGVRRARDIDRRGPRVPVEEEAMPERGGIAVRPDDLTTLVDPEGVSPRGVRDHVVRDHDGSDAAIEGVQGNGRERETHRGERERHAADTSRFHRPLSSCRAIGWQPSWQALQGTPMAKGGARAAVRVTTDATSKTDATGGSQR